MKAILEINNCKQCPFLEEKRHYTGDSWEVARNWFCKKSNGEKIAAYVEWREEKDVEIPDWCPIGEKKK